MSEAAITHVIRAYILENILFGDENVQYSDHDSLMQKGIIDSTGILELIGFIESEFGFAVDDDEIRPENLDSLALIEVYIRKKQKGESGVVSDLEYVS